jgi:tetratricopeptide (TPR) repeat protein
MNALSGVHFGREVRAVYALMMWFALASIALGAAGASGLDDALALERSGDAARALDSIEQLVRRDPAGALAHLEAGRLRLQLGKDLDRAEAHLDAARVLVPENPRVHYFWGLLMEERGRRSEAIRSFETAVLYRPDYVEARFRLAGDYFSQANWAQAVVHYRALCQLRSASTLARFQLAAALERMGKLPEAEEELRRLLKEQPESALYRRKLGEFYARTNRPELASKLLEEPKRKMRELNRSRR